MGTDKEVWGRFMRRLNAADKTFVVLTYGLEAAFAAVLLSSTSHSDGPDGAAGLGSKVLIGHLVFFSIHATYVFCTMCIFVKLGTKMLRAAVAANEAAASSAPLRALILQMEQLIKLMSTQAPQCILMNALFAAWPFLRAKADYQIAVITLGCGMVTAPGLYVMGRKLG